MDTHSIRLNTNNSKTVQEKEAITVKEKEKEEKKEHKKPAREKQCSEELERI